jgi:molybdopterin-guanine dinucleotide biosynthesis protein A
MTAPIAKFAVATLKNTSKRKPNPRVRGETDVPSVEICILAGGLSKRMGRDKSGLLLGSVTMLGAIRTAARATGFPVRVIRRDVVPKCGPLGGIYTALKTTRAEFVLFLACDMPLISPKLMQFVIGKATETRPKEALGKTSPDGALFVCSRGRPGFPFLLPHEAFNTVRKQIEVGNFSLQALAKVLRATILTSKHPWTRQLFNVNTPEDWASLQALHLDR